MSDTNPLPDASRLAASPAPELNRAIVRATSDFFLTAADIAADIADGDLRLGIIWLTVVERGARRAQRSTEQWAAYLRSGAVRPDDQRPPVSVYTISRLLDLPYETTRRGVGRLIAMGMLARVRKGVISPAAFMDSAKVREANAELQARLRRWLLALDRQGLVRLGGGAAGLWPAAGGDAPIATDAYVDEERRKYSRITIGFVVEAGRIVARLADGNLLRGLLLVAIVQANVSRLAADNEQSRQFSSYSSPPPDSLRRPISIFSLSQSLRLPYETARRNIQHLIDEGLVSRSRQGVTVPAAVVLQDAAVQASLASNSLFRQFVGALAEAGLDLTMVE